ncbi:IPT/TIG domain-containing protein [Actinoplanes derwentensis]|nr:IPT/TIG domain-containing protein [Actinoplanes derwentensis]GID86393.1 hypothetical protein Ade03nite_53170 [Actinoplanes derwentensis]
MFLGAPAAFAAALDSLSPVGGPAGTVIKVDAPGTPFDTGNPVAFFATGFASGTACPAYVTSITGQTVVPAGSPTKIDSDEATFVVPPGVTLNSGAAREWKFCVYNGTLATTTAVYDTTASTFTVTPGIGMMPPNGPSGGGNQISFAAPAASPVFATAVGLAFADAGSGCPGTYGTPGSLAAALNRASGTAATSTVPSGVVGTGPGTNYLACFYSGTSNGSTLVGVSASTYGVSLPAVTLSSPVGSWAGGNGITLDSPQGILVGVGAPGVLLASAERCPRTFTAASGYNVVHPAAGRIRKASDTRVALTVPPLAGSAPAGPTPFQICVYNGTTVGASTMLAAAPYTASVVQTLSSIMPASGTALGGTMITVSGTGFPTAPGSIQATLGGLPLTEIMPVNENTFTARTPMHGVERNVALVVTTPAGTRSLSSAYSFLNGIAITPNTASTDIDEVVVAVKGVGFLSTTFSTTVSDAHIYLVRGGYNPADDGASNKVNGPVSECNDVLPISDNELICTLRLDQRLSSAGTITPQIAVGRSVTDIDTTANSRLISSATASFTADDIGKTLTQTAGTAAVQDGTTIVDVLSGTQAILSMKATATVATSVTARIGSAAVRTNGTVDTTNASAEIAADSAAFTSADLGRVITGAGIPAGTTITAIAANGAGATLSANATATAPNITASLHDPLGVPAGAYTLTFVTEGSLGVDTTAAGYSQSTVSASSSFTVAAS